MSNSSLLTTLEVLADPFVASKSQRFFKSKPGDYGAGDQFLGIRVPILRRLAQEYQSINRADLKNLLESPFHEARLCGLFILVHQFNASPPVEKSQTCQFYLDHIACVNNWDLVDSSAHQILGAYLLHNPKDILYTMATSTSLWERRISIMATFAFIKHFEFADTLQIAQILLHDREDLIHKAVGWMLREIGNRNRTIEKNFLNQYAPTMPRTMLRYAIEKFPHNERSHYLALK
ncbi:MAG: DNA alkylation repair protein [Verrucomicrobia bacterium]|nr:DNA alkylation repair protein [Verrucomicrobiota bacterium]